MNTDTNAALFSELVQIIARLRDPKTGCPWDKEQTHASLKPYLIEEAYEVLDAIDHNPAKIKEELGDVLLQVMLHSQIGTDEKTFNIDDVVKILSAKLIKRHPHVFGDVVADSTQKVLENWEEIKQTDRAGSEGLLDGLPKSLPALLKAHRIGEKVARVGFDWPDVNSVKTKVLEELNEFLEINPTEPTERPAMAEELGDLLFSLAQLVRKLGFDSEQLLLAGCAKFIRRFQYMEHICETSGVKLKSLTTEELEQLWQEAKRKATHSTSSSAKMGK